MQDKVLSPNSSRGGMQQYHSHHTRVQSNDDRMMEVEAFEGTNAQNNLFSSQGHSKAKNP